MANPLNISAKNPAFHGLLIHGDNLRAMDLMLDQHAGAIDLVYIDPPFNTKANFYHDPQRTAHVSHCAGSRLAYRDSFGFEEYLEFIRQRLILAHQLLSDCGTLYLHIDVHFGHYLKIILDEIFGRENFLNEIARIKSNPKNFARRAYGNEKDVILVHAKRAGQNIFNDIREPYAPEEIARRFPKIDEFGRRYTTVPCHAPGETRNGATGLAFRGLMPPPGRHWRTSPKELERLDKERLIEWSGSNNPRIKKYADDHRGKKIQDVWKNFKDPQYPVYPTEKNMAMLELVVRQSSNRDSLVMDCFCGSGSFLAAALRQGRRAIGIDNSQTAIEVAKKRPELRDIPLVEMQ